MRRILGQHKPADEEGLLTDNEVLHQLQMPTLEAQLVVEKLRLAGRMQNEQVLAFVAGPGGAAWREEALQAMELFAKMLPSKLALMPSPRQAPQRWEDFWRQWPVHWKQLLKLFVTKVVADPDAFKKAATGTVFEHHPAEADEGWICMRCGKLFPSQAACGPSSHTRKERDQTGRTRH